MHERQLHSHCRLNNSGARSLSSMLAAIPRYTSKASAFDERWQIFDDISRRYIQLHKHMDEHQSA